MAGRGPAPKETRSRPRDQRRVEEMLTVVEADGEARGPELPSLFEWPDATVEWWETWRSSPQAQSFTDTDWSFLLDTAVLHAEFWLGNRALAAELRLRAAKFGATPEDRARLKISIGEPKGGKAPEVRLPTARTQDRRGRLLKVVDGVDES